MLRDFKIFRRHSGKNSLSEANENLPANPSDGSSNATGPDPSRAPLNAIQEPVQNARSASGQESGHKGKIDRTPSRMKRKGGPDGAPLPFPTPERLGVGAFAAASRARFGKNESGGVEVQEETRSDGVHGPTHLPPPSRGGSNGNGGLTSMTPRVVRYAGKASSNHSESGSVWSTQSTPTKSVTKPPNPAFAHSNGCRPPSSMGSRVANFAAMSKGISIASVPSTVVNSVEVPYFELKEDPSFWLDHNVQVLIRVRPLNSTERNSYGYNRCLKQENAQSITWIGQPETRFTFDHVACETVNQEMLFRVAGLPMVENCLSGYNSCMFAYGQTGSGKTHTMLGEIDDVEVRPSTDRGMTPRIFEFLFARIRAEEESRQDEKLKYNCKCSFLEIYNEQISDLLDPSSTNLLLREDIRKGVYVEDLTEVEVETVGDILKLLIQGAANRKVAATNMNRESSRSHSVFTCVIESQWEKDSTINLRFARLNLVDLAGSERQKTSGAEGERLKEAANINKSLSTLGHVIMLLVDVAQGKQRHVPYRDSRLTYLLQDSLGGNSKTMIIATVSPSICCASETLSTLKFAQRAKLIRNNAVVNEDASGDVIALQHQICLLKEELSLLKRQNVSRSLSFRSAIFGDSDSEEQDDVPKGKIPKIDHGDIDESHGCETLGVVRVSTKQLKSLETTLAGAMRREQMADHIVKQLEAEIEQLNRLVQQREEDTRCTKMMLKFREDKIHRMKSLLDGLIPTDSYLLEENNALAEEIQLLRARLDKNPEVTRFALENIRLLDQLRRFQDFYEEGEREILLAEVSELRDQLVQFLDGNYGQNKHPNLRIVAQAQETSPFTSIDDSKEDLLQIELKNTRAELEDCRNNLNFCMELNGKLTREIDDLQSQLNSLKSACSDQVPNVESQKGLPSAEAKTSEPHLLADQKKTAGDMMKQDEDILKLQLELDIVKSILEEERVSRGEIEARALREAEVGNERCLQIRKQCEDVQNELMEARSVIEALESQQFLSISEMEEIRESNERYLEILRTREQEIFILKKQLAANLEGNGKMSSAHQVLRDQPFKRSENEDSPLQANMKRMQVSLEKAKMLNIRYQSDQAYQTTHEQEMDEVRMQVEAETAEVIVCLQEELTALQQQVTDSNTKESEMKYSLMLLETESKELKERIELLTQDNDRLGELLEKKDEELRISSEEWERIACEIAEILCNGHEALEDASDQVDFIAESFPQRRSWIGEHVERMVRTICEKDLLIEELQKCLEDAQTLRGDMELKLRSLRGATLAITEAQQQESSEKEKEVLSLTSQLNAKLSIITDLKEQIRLAEDQNKKAEIRATVAFMTVNRLSEINTIRLEALKHKELKLNESVEMNLQKDALLQDQANVITEADRQIEALKAQLERCEESVAELRIKLLEEKERVCAMGQELEKFETDFAESKVAGDLLEVKGKINEFKMGVHTLNSCMNEYVEEVGRPDKVRTPENHAAAEQMESGDSSPTVIKMTRGICGTELHDDQNSTADSKERSVDGCLREYSFKVGKSFSDSTQWKVNDCQCGQEEFRNEKTPEDVTILLLRKELESALDSLRGVQIQMNKLVNEKEEVKKSENQSRESIKCLTGQVLRLETDMNEMEKQFEFRMTELNHKLKVMGEMVKEADSYISQAKEVLKLELSEAKVLAAQKIAEASSILVKFEEAQGTMKEANDMVDALVAANEMSKLEIERYKKIELSLVNEVQTLQSSNIWKEQQYEHLEKQFHLTQAEATNLVQMLEDILSQMQASFKEELKPIISDIHCLKSQLLQSATLTRTWLEDIWSEIIVKDCAVSVLHLCHIGVLLETVTGLNAENSLLHHGMCESNSVIADLKEHNFRAKREVEMCSVLKGKLLVDIKNSFHRITRKEDETGRLSSKLSSFEKKIMDLQLQEESMLARSNSMGSELALLMKELDVNNKNAFAALLDQEKLLKEREFVCKELDLLIGALSKSDKIPYGLQAGNIELKEGIGSYMDPIKSQTELIMMDLSAKDFELLILTSELAQKRIELQQMSFQKVNLEKESDKLSALIEDVNKEMIFVMVDENLMEHLLNDTIAEVALLKEEGEVVHHQLDLAQGVRHDLLLKLKESSERTAELINEKKALEGDIQSLKEISEKQFSDLSSQSNQLNRLQGLHDEVDLLQDLISRHQNSLDERSRELTELKKCHDIALEELESKDQEMKIQIEQMNLVVNENETLKSELSELTEAREKLSAQVEVLKIEIERLSEELQMQKTALGHGSRQISVLDLENQKLQDQVSLLENSLSRLETELDLKTSELTEVHHSNSIALDNFESEKLEKVNLRGNIDALEVENEKLKSEVENIKAEHYRVLEDLKRKNLELESCSSSMSVFDQENHKLQEALCSLEARITSLCHDLDIKDAELKEECSSHSIIAKELEFKTQDIEIKNNLVNALKAENSSLKTELLFSSQKKDEILTLVNLNLEHLSVVMQDVNLIEKKVFQVLDGKSNALLDAMFKQYLEFEEMTSNFITVSEHLETFAREIISENSSLQAEMARKDEVLKGLSFDLSLLQESASNAKDQKDEIENIVNALESLEDELALKSNELDEAVANGQILEAQLLEKDERISALELELSEGRESLKVSSDENLQLKAHLDDLSVIKNSIEDELVEKCNTTDRLEEELIEMSASLEQMNCYVEGLKGDLSKVTTERDRLDSEVLVLKEHLEMARALAEENEAIATEARQIAESKRSYAEDKEEEVKLLERSVEELEHTINVLENKVEIIKMEAERQHLQREELEMELQTLKHQMSANMNLELQNVARGGDEALARDLVEKLRDFEEVQKKVQSLEKDLAEKDAEITQCKAHITELNMHAEAQAREYKQKFKALEAMAQQVKPEPSNIMNPTTTKMERNASKSRGSGSPFKCIGLGMTHQINSEKDEELTAGRHRIEELEALAASRQKEIFMLNARLAAAESMTHDVIRDLLGVKLDMTNYASLLDHQQVQKITERARIHSEEAQEKGQEVVKLKQQLNEFIEERQGWLDEINRRHAEMVAAQVALEKLRQRDHFLTTENEMLKMDNANHKKKFMELEDEVKKLSGQQNLQQRIHHHAKIKEENNSLRTQNEDLSVKLRRTEAFLSRVKEELTRYRASSGKSPYIDIDEEQRLKRKLEDTEEERVQLAQKLLNLCTCILKAAGITRPVSDISPSVAEEALNQLKDQLASMERELQDWKFKSKISSEKIRLSELRQQSSPLSSRADENCPTPRRISRTSPLSSLR